MIKKINFGLFFLVAFCMSATLLLSRIVMAIPSLPIPATDVVGQPDFDSSSSGTSATELYDPKGVAIDSVNHRMFVADAYNERVLIYDLDSNNEIIDKTADFVLGQPDFTSSSSGTTINSLDLDDGGLVFDELNNRLFVSDESNCRVMVFDTTTITNGEDAINVLGQPDFTSSSCDTDASSFNYNESTLAYDPERQWLFVPEYNNSRVMVFDVSSITNGEDALYVIGQPDFTSSSTSLAIDGMELEYVGTVYDPTTKRLYLTDHNNNRVLVFDTTSISNGMSAEYVLGQPDFTSGTSGTDERSMDAPTALAIDTANQLLYVMDQGNYRILLFDVTSISNGEDAVTVIGQPDFSESTGGTSQTAIDTGTATGMFFEETTNSLYVPDGNNNRILIYKNFYDGDSIDDALERGAPNDGDGNGDGIKDVLQSEVASIPNSEADDTSAYITLQTDGCSTITTMSVSSESDNAEDSGYNYPVGLADFSINCASAGDTTTIVIYYDKNYDTNGWVARKYINGAYSNIAGAVFGTATVGNSTVTTLTYSVTDGGELDADGVANGVIVDPAGPAVAQENPASVGAPDTGLTPTTMTAYTLTLILGITLLTYVSIQSVRIQK